MSATQGYERRFVLDGFDVLVTVPRLMAGVEQSIAIEAVPEPTANTPVQVLERLDLAVKKVVMDVAREQWGADAEMTGEAFPRAAAGSSKRAATA